MHELGLNLFISHIKGVIVKIINVSPHALNFRNEDGSEFAVEPSGTIVNATAINEEVGSHPSGAKLIRVRFIPNDDAIAAIERIEQEAPDAIIVGSLIAAQAFPGRVVAMVAAEGYERRPPAEKRMRPDLFTIF